MRIEIFDETPKEEEEVLRLRLVATDDGGVLLQAVGLTGRRLFGGNILKVTYDGFLIRSMYCKAPGIRLTVDGQIQETL